MSEDTRVLFPYPCGMLPDSSFPLDGAAPSRPRKTRRKRSQGYRRFFTRDECALLDAFSPDSALNEISLIRFLIKRVLAAVPNADPHPKSERDPVSLTLSDRFTMLITFCHAADTIASLSRFQLKDSPPSDPTLDALAALGDADCRRWEAENMAKIAHAAETSR